MALWACERAFPDLAMCPLDPSSQTAFDAADPDLWQLRVHIITLLELFSERRMGFFAQGFFILVVSTC